MRKIPAAKIQFAPEDIDAVVAHVRGILESGALTLGGLGRELESGFRDFVGARHAIGVNSGTSALEIILRALGVDREGSVLVQANTFFATAAAVLHAGGVVRFVDVDPQTLSLSVATLEDAVDDRTTGVVATHIGGFVSPEIPAVREWCERRGLFFVEDAAHAHGSSLDGRMAGTFGQAAAFSFYPTKVMTSGEGGMIVTDSDEISAEAILYRDQGKESFSSNYHVRLGYNWRMSEPHAAIGLAHLAHLGEFIEGRRKVAASYDAGLEDVEGVEVLPAPPGCSSNYYKYVAMLSPNIERSTLKKRLREEHGVSLSGEVYEVPCHQQPIFKEYAAGSFPNAEEVCMRHICLPIFPGMEDADVDYVLRSLTAVLGA